MLHRRFASRLGCCKRRASSKLSNSRIIAIQSHDAVREPNTYAQPTEEGDVVAL